MPTIGAFFGIVIRMYYDDHAPPQFHHRDDPRRDWLLAEAHQPLAQIEPLE
jgi:hypothetical protein